MDDFYVYVFLDPRKPGSHTWHESVFDYQLFYVGKGRGRRWRRHLAKKELSKNIPKSNKIQAIRKAGMEPLIVKVVIDLSEQKALDIEREMISKFGKVWNGGMLVNQVDGGVGTSGLPRSEETKRKISQSLQGVNVGRYMNEQWRQKIADNNAKYWQDKHHSDDTKEKLSKINKGKKYPRRCVSYKLIDPEGNEFIVSNGLEQFCRNRNLCRSHLVSVAGGKRKSHKGWKAIKLKNSA